MIAYHFPPLAGSSGIQRTLRFVQHLPALGWQPLVLTANPKAYQKVSEDLVSEVPPETVVRRAFALDTARHLNLGGRYMGWMARPDRWVSWKFDAIRQGRNMIKEFKPDIIWSTYPIATAHVIAASLHRYSKIPWVADFRDPMAQEGYPPDPTTRQAYLDIEGEAMVNAALCVFTTPGAASDYRQRYPKSAGRITVLENGYDEESFASGIPHLPRQGPAHVGPLVLLHSGIIYPSERDPTHLFAALRKLHACGTIGPADIRIRFRAAIHDDMLRSLAKDHGIEEFVELKPAIPYREALSEMMGVDALLVIQASNCNAQIPAKVYEYLRAGRPIIALTDPRGDTAGVLRGAGVSTIAPLDSESAIAELVQGVIRQIRDGTATAPNAKVVERASRKARSESLTNLLDQVYA